MGVMAMKEVVTETEVMVMRTSRVMLMRVSRHG